MTVRLALIGCGGIARAHLKGYAAIRAVEPELFELVAVCDANLAAAQEVATAVTAWQEETPAVFGDVADLLAATDCDAADICAPHFLHHRLGIACLEAGLHVQIEKPIGITVRATHRLIAAAARAGRQLATAENVRREPGPRTAHWLIHERQLLGTMQSFFVQESRPPQRPMADNAELPPWVWRDDRQLGGGGQVLDSGAHFCDTIRYLFGDVEQVYGRVEQWRPRPVRRGDAVVHDEREDTFVAQLHFANGMSGLWSYGAAWPGHRLNTVVYYGSAGALVDPGDVFHGPRLTATVQLADGTALSLADLHQEYLAELGAAGRARLFPHGLTDGFALEVYDFLTAVRDDRPPEVTGEDGLRAKAIANAIYESNAAGQAVRVAEVIDGQIDAYQRPINERWQL